MKMITVHHTVFINKPPDVVWDYTQDYSKRAVWDESVLEATVLQTNPNRIVKLKLKGKTQMTFVYKLDERPVKTTLVGKDIISPIIERAGGHWLYEAKDGGTLWSQTNTIILKGNVFLSLLAPFFKWLFTRQTKNAMRRVKEGLEG